MYVKGKLVDRREMLRVKIKSLAEEARIIRHEEARTTGMLQFELHLHRVNQVRRASREALYAYQVIRGKHPYDFERGAKTMPDLAKVSAMVVKYGAPGTKKEDVDRLLAAHVSAFVMGYPAELAVAA